LYSPTVTQRNPADQTRDGLFAALGDFEKHEGRHLGGGARHPHAILQLRRTHDLAVATHNLVLLLLLLLLLVLLLLLLFGGRRTQVGQRQLFRLVI
jgi:hypothetical protein